MTPSRTTPEVNCWLQGHVFSTDGKQPLVDLAVCMGMNDQGVLGGAWGGAQRGNASEVLRGFIVEVFQRFQKNSRWL